jgi:hypothetical protein
LKTVPRIFNKGTIAAALLIIDLVFWVAEGIKGGAGFTFGIIGAAFNLWALKAIIGLGANAAPYPKATKLAPALIVLAFFAKLPVFIGLGLICSRIGPPSLTCFLIGVALVYFSLVGWALAQS